MPVWLRTKMPRLGALSRGLHSRHGKRTTWSSAEHDSALASHHAQSACATCVSERTHSSSDESRAIT